MNIRYKLIILIISGVIAYILIDAFLLKKESRSNKNTSSASNEFIGDVACKSCHTKQFNDWESSHHFKPMQPANDLTVIGDFNNAVLTADGVTSRFFKRNKK